MSKRVKTAIILSLILISQTCLAQEAPEIMSDLQPMPAGLFATPEEYMVGKAEKVTELNDMQEVQVRIAGGEENGRLIKINYGEYFIISEHQKVKEGEKLVITKSSESGIVTYSIMDKYRLPSAWIIVFIFLALAFLFGGKKGISAILGLVFSLAILIKFIIPGITSGADPFFITVIGSFIIALVTIYTAHGFEKRTTLALISTLITLIIAIVLGMIFVSVAKLTGAGSEDAYLLQLGFMNSINLRGLLLSGIIIGALGVLDDVTTAQVAAVEEIHKANTSLTRLELYKKGLSVGREHISSMINTLVLAYAGASLPLLIIFSLGSVEPFWVTINHEYMMEEIIRALVGSSALILAVPIATGLAAKYFTTKSAQTLKEKKYRASLFD